MCGLTEVKCSSGPFVSMSYSVRFKSQSYLFYFGKRQQGVWDRYTIGHAVKINSDVSAEWTLSSKTKIFVNSLSKSGVSVVRTVILCGAFNHLRRVKKLPGYKWSKFDPADAMKAYEGVED